MSDSSDIVRQQYEVLPYPARNPKDEANRLIEGSPSHLDELNHYIFAGRRDFSKPFRALVAGGGTGDGAIMLAQQLADRGAAGEVVYVDVSSASRTIAEARAAQRGLKNISFETLSVEQVPGAGLGTFDYIDCCGVLHHLADPVAGLQALCEVLGDDGGMGLMVYGELGRIGVYHMQEMMHLLAPDHTGDDVVTERIDLAKRLNKDLPETNWFRRNSFVADHFEGGDAGLYDLLLHGRDRAYRVPEVIALAHDAHLRITSFIEPARYDPANYISDPRIGLLLAAMGWEDRAAFAELLAGNMRKHIFYMVKAQNKNETIADNRDSAMVPVLRGPDATTLAAKMRPGAAFVATLDGYGFRFSMPRLGAAILERVDGANTLGDIFDQLHAINRDLEKEAFLDQFATIFAALGGLGVLHLRRSR